MKKQSDWSVRVTRVSQLARSLTAVIHTHLFVVAGGNAVERGRVQILQLAVGQPVQPVDVYVGSVGHGVSVGHGYTLMYSTRSSVWS